MQLTTPFLDNVTGSIYNGCYLNTTDKTLYSQSYTSPDIWFNKNVDDVIEFTVWNKQNAQLHWSIINPASSYNCVTSSYQDEKNIPVTYSYAEIKPKFSVYNGQSILINPLVDLKTNNIPEGSYSITYNFIRNIAGSPEAPLTIADISPDRTEIKIQNNTATLNNGFVIFSKKQLQIKTVAGNFISVTSKCSYFDIFNKVKSVYTDAINALKNLYYLKTDADVVYFIKNAYDDYTTYTNIPLGTHPTTTRFQGIKSFFSNYLLSNYEEVTTFESLQSKFHEFVIYRTDSLIRQIQGINTSQYTLIKNFIVDFYTKHYFDILYTNLKNSFEEKYNAPLKNALNFGNNRFELITNHGYIVDNNQTFLIVKLYVPLDTNVSIKDSVWISNISISPVAIDIVYKNTKSAIGLKISPPNFTIHSSGLTNTDANKQYSLEELSQSFAIEQKVGINKKSNILNIDYSNFANFINFSSAEFRVAIFKDKILDINTLTNSVTQLSQKYSASIASGSVYPYYTSERNTLEKSISDINTSFDEYEVYLNNSGTFTIENNTFISASYIDELQADAKEFDVNNTNYLVNTAPDFIKSDEKNNDYLVFLSMVGHYFDNIYNYIQCLTRQKDIVNNPLYSLSKKFLQTVLGSFGWEIENELKNVDVDINYLSKNDFLNYDETSFEDRLRSIWNRILVTLPLIYKTKGTETCVRLLLSCYGIPSTLLTIREFGGPQYATPQDITYTEQEQNFILKFSGANDYLKFNYDPFIQTTEFKAAFDKNYYENYGYYRPIKLVTKHNYLGQQQWEIGAYRVPGKYQGKLYFSASFVSGSIPFIDVQSITSSTLPIFNGELNNIMFRKNDVDALFQDTDTTSVVPTKFDLYTKQINAGQLLFESTASKIFTKEYNQSISETGSLYFGNYSATNNFKGNLDKILLWKAAVSDANFTDHANDINSYSYTGSGNLYEDLYFRMNYETPTDLFNTASVATIQNQSDYYSSNIGYAYNFPIIATSMSLSEVTQCPDVSQSTYPYQFDIKDVTQAFKISNFGPNKFNNVKIRKESQIVSARFDAASTSTVSDVVLGNTDSNQLGLFIDTNHYKNKDIFRFLGNYGLLETIGDPGDMYSATYSNLKSIRETYFKNVNKKVLYNELITLYKFYFNPAVFSAIRNIIPARANLITGLLIEPAAIERPKYQYKPIQSETLTNYSASFSNLQRISSTINYGGFGISTASYTDYDSALVNSLPNNYNTSIDISFINNKTTHVESNINNAYGNSNGNAIEYGQYGYSGISENTPEIIGQELPVYLMKRWKKYQYSHSPSASAYLYDVITISQELFERLIYQTQTGSLTDISDISIGSPPWLHRADTFKETPNQTVSNTFVGSVLGGVLNSYTSVYGKEYLELVKGYQRNHQTHKRNTLSAEKYPANGNLYIRSRVTSTNTINASGINNNTDPIVVVNTGNVNIISAKNRIN